MAYIFTHHDIHVQVTDTSIEIAFSPGLGPLAPVVVTGLKKTKKHAYFFLDFIIQF